MAETPTLWPFAASGEVDEVLEWRTDVLQARRAEQRIALRPRPRVILTLRHRLDASGLARAAAMARANVMGAWAVPLWHWALPPTADLVRGESVIALDTLSAPHQAPGHVTLALDGGQAALMAVTDVEPDRLILAEPLGAVLPDASVAAARATVAPVGIGRLAAAVDIARRRQSDGTVTATFLLQDAPDLPDPGPLDASLPVHLGHPVLTDPSVMRRPLAATLRQAVEYVDNGYGPVVVEPLRDLVEHAETITLEAHGAAARARQARFLWSLRGRQAAFWLPSWGRDLALTAPVSVGTTLMRVAPVGNAGAWVGRSVMLETPTGLAFRSIASAAEAPGEHRLALSASLGLALAPTTPVHLMTLVRSDTDRIEVRHGPVASAVSLPVLEVPA